MVKLIVSFMASPWGSYVYIAFMGISYLYGIYNSIQVGVMYNKIINMLHSRLNIMSQWIKTCMTLYNGRIGFESIEIRPILEKINILRSEERRVGERV